MIHQLSFLVLPYTPIQLKNIPHYPTLDVEHFLISTPVIHIIDITHWINWMRITQVSQLEICSLVKKLFPDTFYPLPDSGIAVVAQKMQLPHA